MVATNLQHVHPVVVSHYVDPIASREFAKELKNGLENTGAFGSDDERMKFIEEYLPAFRHYFSEALSGIALAGEVNIFNGLTASTSIDDLEISKSLVLMLTRSIEQDVHPYQFLQDRRGTIVSTLVTKSQISPDDVANGLERHPHHVDMARGFNQGGHPDILGRPHYVVLGGVKNLGAMTTYASIQDVALRSLSPRQVEKLKQRDFITDVESHVGMGQLDSGPMSVLWHTAKGSLAVSLNQLTRPLHADDDDARIALEALQRAVVTHEYQFAVENGVYAVISNLRGTHSRTPIREKGSRILVRAYAGPIDTLRRRTRMFDLKEVGDYRWHGRPQDAGG